MPQCLERRQPHMCRYYNFPWIFSYRVSVFQFVPHFVLGSPLIPLPPHFKLWVCSFGWAVGFIFLTLLDEVRGWSCAAQVLATQEQPLNSFICPTGYLFWSGHLLGRHHLSMVPYNHNPSQASGFVVFSRAKLLRWRDPLNDVSILLQKLPYCWTMISYVRYTHGKKVTSPGVHLHKPVHLSWHPLVALALFRRICQHWFQDLVNGLPICAILGSTSGNSRHGYVMWLWRKGCSQKLSIAALMGQRSHSCFLIS